MMPLDAIIVRFEGVAFSTRETFRRAANEVLADAGFKHRFDAEAFALQFGHYICKERFLDFAARALHPNRQSDDLRSLMEMTYRRIVVTAEEIMMTEKPPYCREISALIAAGAREGVRFGVVTSIKAEAARKLVAGAMGDVPVFAPTRYRNDWTGTAFERSIDALRSAIDGLGVLPAASLALQSSSYGLAAAESLGVAAVAVIDGTSLNGGLYGARAVVDTLVECITDRAGQTDEAVGAAILKTLRELHADERKEKPCKGRTVMQVRNILKDKGSSIKSVLPADTVQYVAKRLSGEKVGAMVVISPGGTLEGIVTERDIIRGLAVQGCELLGLPVTSIMTRAVITCSPADSIYGVAKVMTNRRIRHLPVSEQGRLVGLVSIGDVLSRRLEEVQLEADVLRDSTIALR